MDPFPEGEDGKEQPGELNWLHGVSLDSQGNLYAVDITATGAEISQDEN